MKKNKLGPCISILSDISVGKVVILLLEPLEVRRDMLCQTFAKKTLNSRHKDMFQDQHQHFTRNKTKFYEHYSKNGRYFNSPLNYLTRLLNGDE